VEDAHSLPRWALLAVGSRETNLGVAFAQGQLGDNGHGHGVWQLDDQHPIPAGFDTDPRAQAEMAAKMLAGFIAAFPGNLLAGLAAYNHGVGGVSQNLKLGLSPDHHTANNNYGSDVLARLQCLQRMLGSTPEPVTPGPAPAPSPEVIDEMIATDPTNGDYWVLTGPEGGLDAYNANGTKGNRFYGNLIDHPKLSAGPGTPNGPAVGIGYWKGDDSGSGYVIYTRDGTGNVHPYHFNVSTRVTAPASG
jgi:hypothetical protein